MCWRNVCIYVCMYWFIFRLDRVHSHITFCNIIRDDATQLRIYVVGAKIIASFVLISILLCWSSAVRIPVAHCLQFPHTVATMITTNNMQPVITELFFSQKYIKQISNEPPIPPESTKVDGKHYCLEKRVYCKWKRFTKH